MAYMGHFLLLKKAITAQKNSVSYGGQIARQLQHNALKKLASKGNPSDPTNAPEKKMLSYLNTKINLKHLQF